MFLVDSHCHFDLLNLTFDELHQVILRAKERGVHYFLNVSVSLSRFAAILNFAEKYPFISVSAGLHPNDQAEQVNLHTLIDLAKNPKVIAIGETGLDYFRSTGDLEWQKERFKTHISAAKKAQLPLIVHTRNAKEDTIRLLQEENANQVGGVMHCFTEDWEMAQKALEMNFYISFSGIVTFKNASAIQAAAKKVPLDRILIETDSPYLAPNPKRGEANEPANVRYTAEYLADLRGIPLDEFAAQTTNNFFQLFKGAIRPHV